MSSKLAVIRELREKGASIKMMDDVALHVGGYESPVFIATVEFILKIKNMVLEYKVSKEQGVSVGTEQKTEKFKISTDNVDFNAAKSATNQDDDLSDDERKQVLESIEAVELQKQNGLEQEMAQVQGFAPKVQEDDKSKKGKKTFTKSVKSFIDKLTKQNAVQAADKHNKEVQDSARVSNMQQAARRQQQQQSSGQSAQQQGSLLKMNIMKMRLMSALKEKKDRSIYGDAQWKAKQSGAESKLQTTDGNNNLGDDRQNQQQNQQVNAIKHVKSKNAGVSKSSQDMMISTSIDQIIKNDKAKGSENVTKEQAEKGKFTQKVEEKSSVAKADEEAVAKMAAKDAIAKLQNSGVRTTAGGDATKAKADMEAQLAQNNTQQQQQNPQKQR